MAPLTMACVVAPCSALRILKLLNVSGSTYPAINLCPARHSTFYFFFGGGAEGRRCDKSEAATDLICGVLFGLDKILLAIEASFLPVVIAQS
jgi:hypothetical protein